MIIHQLSITQKCTKIGQTMLPKQINPKVSAAQYNTGLFLLTSQFREGQVALLQAVIQEPRLFPSCSIILQLQGHSSHYLSKDGQGKTKSLKDYSGYFRDQIWKWLFTFVHILLAWTQSQGQPTSKGSWDMQRNTQIWRGTNSLCARQERFSSLHDSPHICAGDLYLG